MARLTATLASRNENKARELARALPEWDVRLLDAAVFPPEDGATYYENALMKARFGRTIGRRDAWTVGEDSGIEVAALGGGPGIESARWAEDGVARLLAELRGVDTDARRARYVCELVCLSPAGEEFRGRGELAGRIAEERRGCAGFGYDPIFVPDGETATVAELGDRWKAEHSHRARAAHALRDAVANAGAPRP